MAHVTLEDIAFKLEEKDERRYCAHRGCGRPASELCACKLVYYCSTQCAKKDWEWHRRICRYQRGTPWCIHYAKPFWRYIQEMWVVLANILVRHYRMRLLIRYAVQSPVLGTSLLRSHPHSLTTGRIYELLRIFYIMTIRSTGLLDPRQLMYLAEQVQSRNWGTHAVWLRHDSNTIMYRILEFLYIKEGGAPKRVQGTRASLVSANCVASSSTDTTLMPCSNPSCLKLTNFCCSCSLAYCSRGCQYQDWEQHKDAHRKWKRLHKSPKKESAGGERDTKPRKANRPTLTPPSRGFAPASGALVVSPEMYERVVGKPFVPGESPDVMVRRDAVGNLMVSYQGRTEYMVQTKATKSAEVFKSNFDHLPLRIQRKFQGAAENITPSCFPDFQSDVESE